MNKNLNFIILILGIIVNIGALLSPFLPTASIWLSILFLIFALSFWMYIGYKAFLLKIKLLRRKIPHTFHSDWNFDANRIVPIKHGIDRINLKKIEILSLFLLFADRLETGAWSKTLIVRFKRNNKTISPVGSLTSTYMVFESLRFYNYKQNSKNIDILFANLAKVLTPDGLVVQTINLNATGGFDIFPENLRHSSAYFLLRKLRVNIATQADLLLINQIRDDLESRLKRKHKSDMQGSAFGLAALFSSLFWLKKQFKNEVRIIIDFLKFFSELDEISTPGHPAWGEEPGAAAASNTAAQWVVAWLLVGLLSWNEINKDIRFNLSDRLISLIEANIILVPEHEKLLPHSFSGIGVRQPHGESLLATGIALYISSLLYLTSNNINIINRAKLCVENLLNKISLRGVWYAVKGSLEEPIEGYLAWASCLLALRPFLYSNYENKLAVTTMEHALLYFGTPEKIPITILTIDEIKTLISSCQKIEQQFVKSGVKLYPNGLYQPLNGLRI